MTPKNVDVGAPFMTRLLRHEWESTNLRDFFGLEHSL
jgi:hypothetical protein